MGEPQILELERKYAKQATQSSQIDIMILFTKGEMKK